MIRATAPHSSLRSYVGTLCDISLPWKITPNSPCPLYGESCIRGIPTTCNSIYQQSNESPQQFLFRPLDLRNKVDFASQESDCEFNYDLSLIQKTIAKSFETGLHEDFLASSLRATRRNDLKVPFLVTEQCLDSLLNGFNFIEEIMKVGNGDVTLFQVTTSSFTDLDNQTASILVNFIESFNQEELCFIKTTTCDTTIPPKKELTGHLQSEYGTTWETFTGTVWSRWSKEMALWFGDSWCLW